jgi:hypothetical protein
MRNYWFPIRKVGIFSPGKEIKGLRGGVHGYAAQASPKIDATRRKKHPIRTETSYRTEPKGDSVMACKMAFLIYDGVA